MLKFVISKGQQLIQFQVSFLSLEESLHYKAGGK